MRDTQRAKVYAAEEFVRTLFDRAAQHGTGAIDFFGTALTLPPEARFGSVESVRRYVTDVLDMPAVRERWPGAAPLEVRSRRGETAAHYESGTIAVPDRHGTWALRELVVFFGHFTAVYRTIPAKGSQRSVGRKIPVLAHARLLPRPREHIAKDAHHSHGRGDP